MRSGAAFDPVMAFNDVRISGVGRAGKNFKTDFRNTRPKNEPQRNNFTNKDIVVKGDEKDLEEDAQHDWILSELDFEKVVVQRGKDEMDSGK